jgi:hypothetical protein
MPNTKKKFKCNDCGATIPTILNESTNQVCPSPICPECDIKNSAIEIIVEEVNNDKKLLCD